MMQLTSERYVSSLSGVSWSGRDGSPGMAMLGNNGYQPVASRYSVMPVILLTVMHNRSRSKAKWFIKKVTGALVRPCRIQSLSVLIVYSTYPLPLVLPMVMWRWTMPSPLHRRAKLPENSAPLLSRHSAACPNGQPGHCIELGHPPTMQ